MEREKNYIPTESEVSLAEDWLSSQDQAGVRERLRQWEDGVRKASRPEDITTGFVELGLDETNYNLMIPSDVAQYINENMVVLTPEELEKLPFEVVSDPEVRGAVSLVLVDRLKNGNYRRFVEIAKKLKLDKNKLKELILPILSVFIGHIPSTCRVYKNPSGESSEVIPQKQVIADLKNQFNDLRNFLELSDSEIDNAMPSYFRPFRGEGVDKASDMYAKVCATYEIIGNPIQ